ncbi:hypothetical protein KJ877_08120, partial [bacterium]|nr:hypothetical protein [bacterium]
MKKLLLVMTLLLFPSYLFAKKYCIYIDSYDLKKKNKSVIESTLLDVAYPSLKMDDGKILIFSGEFNNYDDAKKLLHLTKSRYKNAEVSLCDNTEKYNKNVKIFVDDIPVESSSAKNEESNSSTGSTYYCLKVFETDLISSQKHQNKIEYIINRLPNSYTKIDAGKIIIYSGKFDSFDTAQIIASMVKKEFNATSVSTCSSDEKIEKILLEKEKNIPKKEHAEQKFIVDNEYFDINSLDEKGLINSEISSSTQGNQKDEIKKSDIRHALDTQREEQFNGLYLKVNTAWDTLNNEMAYDARLELDIFDQGYYESKKKN